MTDAWKKSWMIEKMIPPAGFYSELDYCGRAFHLSLRIICYLLSGMHQQACGQHNNYSRFMSQCWLETAHEPTYANPGNFGRLGSSPPMEFGCSHPNFNRQRSHSIRNRGKRTREDSDPFDRTLRCNGFTLSNALATFEAFSVAAVFAAPIAARGFGISGTRD